MSTWKSIAYGWAAALACVTLPVQAQQAQPVKHASPELIKLADEFHAFRSPLFRARTWRPTHEVKGVPDYAAVKREQLAGLPKFRERLSALDPKGWPVHDQVDYLVLRSEMDDVYFEQVVLREVETNPGYYIEQAIDGVADELKGTVPYSAETANAIISAFERTGPILAQGPKTIVLAEAAPELAKMGLKNVEDIRGKYAAGVKLFEPHFPASHRGRLKTAADKAARDLESYGKWISANLGQMKGKPHVGKQNMEWYFKRVNFNPWSIEETQAMGEFEKNRFLRSVEIEEKKNAGLKELTMPTTQEWIEWFRLTYLQTKYFLKEQDLISFHPYIGESYIEEGTWQEPFGGVGNRPGLLGFNSQKNPPNTKRLFVVNESHPFTKSYWERTMRLDPITDFQHSDWPGHYFEAQVTQRNPCPIRAVHKDTGFSQGWAHYFEELFMDMDYPFLRGPRTRELTYNFLLLRAVRVPMDIGLSDGTYTVDEAVQYQIDRVPSMEPHISRAEVDMYVRWPYQATSYIVGKQQIEQMLGDEIYKGKFNVDWRKFHDAILASGQIPLALVRWEVTGNKDQIKALWDQPELPAGAQ